MLSGLPTDIYLGKDENVNRWIYTVTVSDPDNDPVSCSNTVGGKPNGQVESSAFDFKYNSILSGRCLSYLISCFPPETCSTMPSARRASIALFLNASPRGTG